MRFAKKVGDEFEKRFANFINASENSTAIRIPNGCLSVGANKLIRIKSPFDFVLAFRDDIIFCDTKTTKSNAFPLIAKTVNNQMYNFEKLAKHNKACGYLIEFREAGEFRWFNYKTIKDIMSKRSSLPREAGILIGHTFPTEINLDLVLENP